MPFPTRDVSDGKCKHPSPSSLSSPSWPASGSGGVAGRRHWCQVELSRNHQIIMDDYEKVTELVYTHREKREVHPRTSKYQCNCRVACVLLRERYGLVGVAGAGLVHRRGVALPPLQYIPPNDSSIGDCSCVRLSGLQQSLVGGMCAPSVIASVGGTSLCIMQVSRRPRDLL